METLLIMLLMPLPLLTDRVNDPAPGITQSRQDARNLECTRMSQAQAHQLYPGQVPEPSARTSANLMEIDALTCTQRMIRYGDRPARDEVILSTLREQVGEITEVAGALGTPSTTWYVDAFYPQPRVTTKIAVAARTALAERGYRVSDKVPLLAAGDLLVLRDLEAKDAYRLACERYFAQGILSGDDAFLGIMIVDARETQLHAGVCTSGRWRWLR